MVTIDGEYIPFWNIESMNSTVKNPDTEQQIVDKLNDDYIIRIRTRAGFEYYCSMLAVIKHLRSMTWDGTPQEFFEGVVFEAWINQPENKI